MMLALLCTLGHAASPDETLRFSVRWMGIEAGVAEMVRDDEGAIRTVTVRSRSAPWLDGMYPVDDHIVSEARLAGGSVRYRTRFREGGFQQDQDMRFDGGEVQVHRAQLRDGTWGTSDATVSVPPGAEDPVSAFYRIREAHLQPGQTLVVPVFNGRRTVDVVAFCLPGETPRHISVRSTREGDFKGAIDLYLDDADVPLGATVQTRAGSVRVERVP